jgi:hypothetical protein
MQATENGVQHVNVKFFVKNADAIKMSDAIGVFQKWIQEDKIDDLLIDVADYAQVPDGPGIVLVGHNTLYSLDNNEGRLGVLVNRRTVADGSNQDLVKAGIEKAGMICQMLLAEDVFKGNLEFANDELQIIVNDRRLAPNTDETLGLLKPDLEAALAATLGVANYTFERNQDPRSRFAVNVKSDKTFTV